MNTQAGEKTGRQEEERLIQTPAANRRANGAPKVGQPSGAELLGHGRRIARL